jgi:hypothetical protein
MGRPRNLHESRAPGWHVVVFGLGLAACTRDLPMPDLSGVTPAILYNGEETALSISGAHLYPAPRLQAVPSAESALDDAFEVVLVGSEGDEVALPSTWRAVDALTAVAPPGVAVGQYDLRLRDPLGRSDTLADAVTVSDVRAERLVLELSQPVAEVNAPVELLLSVVDAYDRVVPSPVPVEVALAGPSSEFTFGAGLGGQMPRDAGRGVRGSLSADGTAALPLTMVTPGQYTVTVSSPGDGLSADRASVLWLAGSQLTVEIGLPSADFEVVAGVPFDVSLRLRDQFGNAVDETPQSVVLRDTCGSWVAPVNVDGPTVVSATLTRATEGVICAEDRIEVVSGPAGQSEPVRVIAAAAAEFRVVAAPGRVVAGTDIGLFVTPLDAWGNLASWFGTVSLIRDSAAGIGEWNCSQGSPVFCTAAPRRAGAGIFVQVDGSDGLTGRSNVFAVSAAEFSRFTLDVPESVTVGVAFPMIVRPTDAFGNPVDATALVDESFVVSRTGDEALSCVPGLATPDDLRLSCVATAAGDEPVTLIHSGGASTTVAIDVLNGPLARVEVRPRSVTTSAGDPLIVDVSGFDAFDNPITRGAAGFELTDVAGEIEGVAVSLDGSGAGTAQILLEKAGTTAIVAVLAEAELGRSDPVLVNPAQAAALRLTLGATWLWVDETTDLRVESVDRFGNRSPVDATVALTTRSGEGALPTLALTNGVGVGSVSWSTALPEEDLTATAGGLEGRSATFAVVADCPDFRSPTLVVRGSNDERACTDAADAASYLISVSSPGGTRWLGAVDGDLEVVSDASGFAVSTSGIGRHRLDVLAIRADGCGAEANAELWAGPDDGRPVGPVGVSLSRATVGVGDPLTGTVEVTLSDLVDCTGDPAIGQPVFVRVDRGELSGVTATGAGLALTADGFGAASATWSFLAATAGGAAELRVSAGGGAATGLGTVVATGDGRRPRVWEQSPLGGLSGPISSAVLLFSEPLLGSSVNPAAFAVAGPVVMPVAVTGAVLAPGGREVTLAFDPAIDPAVGAFSIEARPQLRDLAGNRLDGAFINAASAWSGPVGTSGVAPSIVACEAGVTRFRPDGDDGAGTEGDGVLFTWSASSVPTWWVLSIYQGDELIRREWRTPNGAADGWRWDGRDATERVVPDGAWELTVASVDGFGNRSLACAVPVTAANGY